MVSFLKMETEFRESRGGKDIEWWSMAFCICFSYGLMSKTLFGQYCLLSQAGALGCFERFSDSVLVAKTARFSFKRLCYQTLKEYSQVARGVFLDGDVDLETLQSRGNKHGVPPVFCHETTLRKSKKTVGPATTLFQPFYLAY